MQWKRRNGPITVVKERALIRRKRDIVKKTKYPKYTKFDMNGIPTHDHNHNELSYEERQKLMQLMNEKIQQLNPTSSTSSVMTITTTNPNDGSKEIYDPSLMFRGMVIT